MKNQTAKTIEMIRQGIQTPRMIIDLPDLYKFRIYTLPKTRNGYASLAVLFGGGNAKEFRTLNGQYSQTNQCLEKLFKHLGLIPEHLRETYKKLGDISKLIEHFHVGGNYYKVNSWGKL